MKFAVLHADGTRRGVLDDAVNDAIKIGATVDEEVFIALEYNILVACEFHQFERAGANNILAVLRMAFGILAVTVHMLWNDGEQLARHRQQERGVWLAQIEDSGMLVWCINRSDHAKHGFKRVVFLYGFNGKRDIL